MKKTAILILMILFCIGLPVPCSAVGVGQSVQCNATVSGDSSCTVTLTVALKYTTDEVSPVFPIPKAAEDVTLNGEPATMFAAASSRMVSLKSLTGGHAGTYQFTLRYRLPSVVSTTEENGMLLDLQLLAGFPYPIDSFTATVTLPGSFDATPQLTSGYYQQDVRELLAVSQQGNQITIENLRALKDNETLSLQLQVDGTLFPKTEQAARVLGVMDLAILIAVVLAAAYYLLTMRPTLRRYASRAAAPDSVTAGEIGLWYIGAGVDLTMLVITWAQLGYIRIQVDKDGRVLLHKRMDMGNERSAYENKCYRELFGRRSIVDGTGLRYAELRNRMAKKSPRLHDVFRPKSGNPYVFRLLCAVSALLSGIALAGAFAPYSGFLRFFMAALTTLMAFLIQSGTRYLFLRHRIPIRIALVAMAVWMILGIWSGEWIMTLLQIIFQAIAGVALAFGGRRTELGQQAQYQIAGLRRHMRRVSKHELQRLLKGNPNYFYDLAPYALALGLDKTFARRFARLRMVECTYLIRSSSGLMTASEWAALLRSTANTLDARSRRLFWEKLTRR
jgi:hypothetical protein